MYADVYIIPLSVCDDSTPLHFSIETHIYEHENEYIYRTDERSYYDTATHTTVIRRAVLCVRREFWLST